MTPSFLGLLFTGFLNLIAVILFLIYSTTMTATMILQTFLLLSISIGIHSILHFQQEIHYNFNPLEGRWFPKKESFVDTEETEEDNE